MAKRIILKLEHCTVRFNTELREYSVGMNVAARGDDSATYYTNDKEDAIHTAARIEARMDLRDIQVLPFHCIDNDIAF